MEIVPKIIDRILWYKNKKTNEDLTITNEHRDKIVNIKHYKYELNKQDFILSSSQD